jgi:pimeloyl-ACP methyl ester carboxylesterase
MNTRSVNGIELAYVDRGQGPPVLLVHGFPLDHTMYNAQIEALAGRHRVIAVDLRGFGQSGVTEGTVTMRQFADDLAALLDVLAITERIVFCGLSMGGYVAWQFWRNHTRRVRALILCDTRAIADTPEVAQGRLQMADRVTAEGPGPLVEVMMPKLFAGPTVANHPQVVESLRRVMLSSDPRGVAAAARGMAQRPDLTGMLPRIGCPSLVLVGELDAISTVDEMRAVAQAIPAAQFNVIAGSGHMSTMEKPAEVNAAILDFLDTLAD